MQVIAKAEWPMVKVPATAAAMPTLGTVAASARAAGAKAVVAAAGAAHGARGQLETLATFDATRDLSHLRSSLLLGAAVKPQSARGATRPREWTESRKAR